MSNTAYPKLDQVQSAFKDLVWDNVVQAGITALFAQVPWLNAWPIGGAVRYLLTLFADKIFDSVKLSIDLQAIVLVNQEHKVAYNKELAKLKIVAREKGIESPEFAKERENAKKALSKFVSYGATP